jgi:hypothetical protein
MSAASSASVCEAAANDMSHNYPRAPFVWLIAEKNNITVLCRGCHNDFGNNQLWRLSDGWKILRTMMALLLSEEDDHRRQLMRSSLYRQNVQHATPG